MLEKCRTRPSGEGAPLLERHVEPLTLSDPEFEDLRNRSAVGHESRLRHPDLGVSGVDGVQQLLDGPQLPLCVARLVLLGAFLVLIGAFLFISFVGIRSRTAG